MEHPLIGHDHPCLEPNIVRARIEVPKIVGIVTARDLDPDPMALPEEVSGGSPEANLIFIGPAGLPSPLLRYRKGRPYAVTKISGNPSLS